MSPTTVFLILASLVIVSSAKNLRKAQRVEPVVADDQTDDAEVAASNDDSDVSQPEQAASEYGGYGGGGYSGGGGGGGGGYSGGGGYGGSQTGPGYYGPETNDYGYGFECAGKKPAFYGDAKQDCKVFYICQSDGRTDTFRCPKWTRFNNYLGICDWHFKVDNGCNPLDTYEQSYGNSYGGGGYSGGSSGGYGGGKYRK